MRIPPVTLWFTGLSGAGKSTLALSVRNLLAESGVNAFILDGDVVRTGLNRDLGYEPEARTENIRRIAEVAKMFNDAGVVAIAALISPYRDDRVMAKTIIGPSRFVETHLAADLEICERRDPKGLYARAREGAIPNFTGVSGPYEVPLNPDLRVETGIEDPETCSRQIVEFLCAQYAWPTSIMSAVRQCVE